MSIYKRICCTVVVCAIAATFSSCRIQRILVRTQVEV